LRASEFLRKGWLGYEQLRQTTLDISVFAKEEDVKIAPAIPNPGKIICVGLNYRKHAAESGMDEPAYPLLFSKFNNTIASHKESVPLESDWGQVDYEAELVVVMGKKAKNVSEEDALNYRSEERR